LSPSGRALIREGTRRIYHPNGRPWNGTWCLLTYSIPESRRALRDRIRKRLAWLGFGALGSGTYVAPHDASGQVRRLAEELGAGGFARTFLARGAGATRDAVIAREGWDLPAIAASYLRFIRAYGPKFERDRVRKRRRALPDAEAFTTRFALTHDFRRFPFIDPELPRSLLPRNWAGTRARTLFQKYHAMLTGGALRFFSDSAAGAASG
jgi:phenylacetic acid degradation operon negative regulatory protein